jgi:hypothetical protein
MKPCPFCGNTPDALGYSGQPAISWFVKCLHCGAKGPEVLGDAQYAANLAIKLWENRVPQQKVNFLTTSVSERNEA